MSDKMINLNSSNSLVVGALKFVCEKERDSDDWRTGNFRSFRNSVIELSSKLYPRSRTPPELDVKLTSAETKLKRTAAHSGIIFPEFVRPRSAPWIAIRTTLMSQEVETRQLVSLWSVSSLRRNRAGRFYTIQNWLFFVRENFILLCIFCTLKEILWQKGMFGILEDNFEFLSIIFSRNFEIIWRSTVCI